MKKTLIYLVISVVAAYAAFFAYSTAAAQEFYSDGGGWGNDAVSYGDSSYGGGWGGDSSYGGGWGSSYDSGCGSGGCGGYASSYDSGFGGMSYGGGFGGSYGSSGCGSYGCGSGLSYGGGISSGCGIGFGGCGGGYGGSSSYFAPQNTNVSNRYTYTNTVLGSYNTNINSNTNINNNGGGGSLPPVYIPPVYVPPTYYPPTYTPPPVYYPPPVYTPPPIACTVTFLNFAPATFATEGQWYSYNLQAVSTLSNQVSYRLVSGPDGLAVSPTGQVTWTPAFNQGRAAAYEVRVAAYNGGCETNRTFYITVQDTNPVPPPPRPVPPPPAPCCNCVPAATTCVVQPKPIVTGVCPPTMAVPAIAEPAIALPAPVMISDNGGFWASLATAIVAMGAALSALLYSPWLLLLVIVILGVLLFRAYVRSRETTVII